MSEHKGTSRNFRLHPDEAFIPYIPTLERKLINPSLTIQHVMEWGTKGNDYGLFLLTSYYLADDMAAVLLPACDLFPVPPLAEIAPLPLTTRLTSPPIPVESLTLRYNAPKGKWELAPGFSIQRRVAS